MILRKYLAFVEDFLIVRHKLSCLLFALNAPTQDARDRYEGYRKT